MDVNFIPLDECYDDYGYPLEENVLYDDGYGNEFFIEYVDGGCIIAEADAPNWVQAASKAAEHVKNRSAEQARWKQIGDAERIERANASAQAQANLKARLQEKRNATKAAAASLPAAQDLSLHLQRKLDASQAKGADLEKQLGNAQGLVMHKQNQLNAAHAKNQKLTANMNAANARADAEAQAHQSTRNALQKSQSNLASTQANLSATQARMRRHSAIRKDIQQRRVAQANRRGMMKGAGAAAGVISAAYAGKKLYNWYKNRKAKNKLAQSANNTNNAVTVGETYIPLEECYDMNGYMFEEGVPYEDAYGEFYIEYVDVNGQPISEASCGYDDGYDSLNEYMDPLDEGKNYRNAKRMVKHMWKSVGGLGGVAAHTGVNMAGGAMQMVPNRTMGILGTGLKLANAVEVGRKAVKGYKNYLADPNRED